MFNSDQQVDSKSASDLVSISVVGNKRIRVYVHEHVMPLPTTGPKKEGKDFENLPPSVQQLGKARGEKTSYQI